MKVACAIAAVLMTVGSAHAQGVKRVVPGVPLTCPKHFELKETSCVVIEKELTALKDAECKAPGLAFIGRCQAIPNQTPFPTCASTGVPTEFDPQLRACVERGDVQRSSNADYMGDCFTIRALPVPKPEKLKQGESYEVVHQQAAGESDKLLRLAESKGNGMFSCQAKKGAEIFEMRASALEAMGADRHGWAYGILALPYKFHADDKSFGSGVSIGPYVGRRFGSPGSAYTFAFAATIGNVKGEVRDAQNNITDTPDLQAFAVAAGWMYDIAKAPGARPFKLGFFFGTDVVGSSDRVKYKHDKKPWIALQIGFDFTDN